ncbi:MAG: DUF1016 family protein [Paludibacteraceae bacterium]|nr:DUF1016 family protein [Paludibacteraceae bacterium]
MPLPQQFVADVRQIIATARANAVRSVDFCRVQMYWNLGKRILEEEQQGKARADYGTYLIRNLAKEIEPEYGSGFGERQLKFCRQFYREYPIVNTLRSQLNWSQYRSLIQIPDHDKREYYELEAVNNAWTGRELQRQIDSMLYERLLMSNDKAAVLAVARKERIPESPTEIIKQPTVLEFFADLVFYNRLLKCFVIVELKTGELTHQDLGQLQMYVNYYDRNEKLPEENPSIGILLCSRKNDTLVRTTLPEDNTTILASEYQLYLPTEEQLINEIDEVKSNFNKDDK